MSLGFHRHQWPTMMLPLQEGIISRRSSSNDHVHATNMSRQRLHSSYSIQWPTMSLRFHRHQWPTMMLPLQEWIISCRSSSKNHVHATYMSRQRRRSSYSIQLCESQRKRHRFAFLPLIVLGHSLMIMLPFRRNAL